MAGVEYPCGPAVRPQPPASEASSRSTSRSTAVDFFRGLGLWMVYIDHMGPNIWSNLTLWRFGFSDFAEIFIFLSGFIGVGSYERALARGDTSAILKKLGRRTGRLYVAHIVSLGLSLLVLGAFAVRGIRMEGADLYLWMQDPAKYFLRLLALVYTPNRSTLLLLYMVLCPLLPLAAIGFKRAPKRTLGVSAGLWFASQFSAFDSRMLGSGWFFHPLAWQFLFILGAAAWHYADRLKTFAQSRAAVWMAGIVVAGSAVLKIGAALLLALHLVSPKVRAILVFNAGKGGLAPYRLVHFLALAFLVYALTRDRRRWRQWPMARPVVRLAMACGADSLFIYSCSLVLDTITKLILESVPATIVLQTELSVLGLALLCGLAWVRRGSARRWSSPEVSVSSQLQSAPE